MNPLKIPFESNFQQADILVVGSYPGRAESRTNQPFAGDLAFMRSAFEGYNVVFTNAVKCPIYNNTEPTTDELNSCRPYLVGEIRAYRPKVIFALGNPALKTLTGTSGVNKLRNQPLDMRHSISEKLNFEAPKVLCSIHPSVTLRYPKFQSLLEEDVESVKRYLSGVIEAEVKYVDVPIDAIEGQTRLTFDIESSTAAYRDPRYETYCIGTYAENDPEVKILTKDFNYFEPSVQNQSETFNGLGFDLACLNWRKWQSINPKGFHLDAMVLAYLVDEEMKHISLENCAIRWLHVPPWKDEGRIFWDEKIKLARKPADEEEWHTLMLYNARDVIYTHRLTELLWGKLSDDQRGLYCNLLVPAAFSLNRMTENGFEISRKNLEEARIQTQADLDAAYKKLEFIASEQWMFDFNPNSPNQVRQLLYDKLGLKPPKVTFKSKQPSTDQESLKILAQNPAAIEACQALLEYKEPKKLLSSYINRYSEMLETSGGTRLHPPYHLTRTETGRTSGWAQQFPRQKFIRRMVVAREGYKLIVADQSQIELRLMAWRSREPTMLEAYCKDEDIHAKTALAILNLQRLAKGEQMLVSFDRHLYEEQRTLAKAVNFGCLYGAEPWTLQSYLFKEYGLKVTFNTAQWLRDEVFFGTYNHLPVYYDELIDRVKKEKAIRSSFGRIRHLPNIDAANIEDRAEAARQAINTGNQADASDITLIGLNLVRDKAPWLQPIMFVHDNNTFEVPNMLVEKAIPIIRKCMTTDTVQYCRDVFNVNIDVPLVVDIKVCEEWS